MWRSLVSSPPGQMVEIPDADDGQPLLLVEGVVPLAPVSACAPDDCVMGFTTAEDSPSW